MIKKSIFGLIGALFSLALLCGCEDDQRGLGLVNTNFCFTVEGGNISNQLRANEDWNIVIDADSPFVSISPAQGTASSEPINLVMTAPVNSNEDTRSNVIEVNIGEKTFFYNVTQDGTIQKSCIP